MTSDPPSVADIMRAIDPDALLQGEDPWSASADDAVHWLEAYRELLEMKRSALAHLEQMIDSATEEAVEEAEMDRRLLNAQAQRYERRHWFWTERARELALVGVADLYVHSVSVRESPDGCAGSPGI